MIKIIENFLPKAQAESLSGQIYDTNESWWSYVYKYKGLKAPLHFNNTLRDRFRREEVEADFVKSFRQGDFTYKFKRSTPHVPNCTCFECKFKADTLHSPEFLSKISEEMDLQNPYLFESFISAYESGDFLNIHSDEKRGIAFILNLSQGWKPEYGGMLNIMQEDGSFKAIFPKFNSLILMKLGDEGTPHFVSEVSKYAPFARVAIGGWYNER